MSWHKLIARHLLCCSTTLRLGQAPVQRSMPMFRDSPCFPVHQAGRQQQTVSKEASIRLSRHGNTRIYQHRNQEIELCAYRRSALVHTSIMCLLLSFSALLRKPSNLSSHKLGTTHRVCTARGTLFGSIPPAHISYFAYLCLGAVPSLDQR